MKKFLLFLTLLFASHLACGAINEELKKNLISFIEDSNTIEQRNRVLSIAKIALNAIIEYQSEERKETLLHRAAIACKYDLIDWIFSNISDQTKNRLIVIQNQQNDTALHILILCVDKQEKAIKPVQSFFANISENTKKELVLKQNATGDSILHLACAQGFVDIAREILKQITDAETKKKLLELRNAQGQTAWDITKAQDNANTSALLELLQNEQLNMSSIANFLLSNKPEHQQQRRRMGHGIALVSALITGYDYYQYNKQKTKKQNAAQEKTAKNEPESKKNLKQTHEQKKIIVTETKTGFKAYFKALYTKPMKHKKAFAGLIGALVAEYFALMQ
jgi:ankyrin repeat protein